MLRRTTLTRAAVPAVAALAIGLSVPAIYANADVSPAEECVQAGNVWVHVAYDDTVTGACATEFATAQAAIDNTGLSEDQGWIKTVDGRLAVDPEWWSVYSLTPGDDGTYPAEWDFAQVGVAELELSASSVLGLQLQEDWNVDAVPPAVNPVEGVVLADEEEEVAPTPTAEPTSEPTVTATATETAQPTTAPTRPGMPKSGR